jgi:chromosome segregation ATPase
LKQQYQQSVSLKDKQLEATQQRLEELSIYVALLKDELDQIETGKQRLKEQLEEELAHKKDLEYKLVQLSESQVNGSTGQNNVSQLIPVQRLESVGKRLRLIGNQLRSVVTRAPQEKTQLEEQLQTQLKHSSQRESQLRDRLAEQTFKEKSLEQQLTTTTRECEQVDLKLQHQLRKSLYREQGLREQMRKLIRQHKHVLKQVKQEKQAYKKKYKITQTRMRVMEKHTITTLEQLHDELSQQYVVESNFSEKFHKSLQEIAVLLHDQKQEIQKLECL